MVNFKRKQLYCDIYYIITNTASISLWSFSPPLNVTIDRRQTGRSIKQILPENKLSILGNVIMDRHYLFIVD